MNQSKTQNAMRPLTDEGAAADDPTETVAVSQDKAAELIDALDSLLLERAVREHREALARLNTLQQALHKSETE